VHEYCSGPSSHPAVFSLDQAVTVIYLVDFSRSLSPLTNLCAAVVPQSLTNLLRRHHHLGQSSCSQFEYLALASLLKTGYLEGHARKIGQQATQNLSIFKQLLSDCEQTKYTASLKFVRSGKEGLLEVSSAVNLGDLAPAIERSLLMPASKLFGFQPEGSTKFLVSGDRLDEQNSRFILTCLAKAAIGNCMQAQAYPTVSLSNVLR